MITHTHVAGFISDRKDYHEVTHKCEVCGKRYKLPSAIFKPRDRVCFTCEVKEKMKHGCYVAFEDGRGKWN